MDKPRAKCRCCGKKTYKAAMYLLGDGYRCQACLEKQRQFDKLRG